VQTGIKTSIFSMSDNCGNDIVFILSILNY